MKEKNVRSALKSVTWRVTATMLTILIVFSFYGDVKLSLGIGLIEAVLKIVLYYFHERMWVRVNWGKSNFN